MLDARSLTAIEAGGRRYVLGQRLGAGGMGVVYEATCAQRGDRFAIKFLHPEQTHHGRARQRIDAEAFAGLLIHHPHVVAVLDAGTTGAGDSYLVMEHVHGEPLGRRLRREGAMAPARAIEIARQILSGLSAAHHVGIVHGDIKTDNVLVEARADGTDHCKLLDFGLARIQFETCRDPNEPNPAREEWLSGTPEYMAPEVIQGNGPSFCADLYAVGIILYELLTGSTPFAGGTMSEIAERHLADEVVPPSLRCTYEIPASLDRVILRALDKDARARFQTAEALMEALAAVAGEVTVSRPPVLPMPFRARTWSWRRDRDATTVVASPHKRLASANG